MVGDVRLCQVVGLQFGFSHQSDTVPSALAHPALSVAAGAIKNAASEGVMAVGGSSTSEGFEEVLHEQHQVEIVGG